MSEKKEGVQLRNECGGEFSFAKHPRQGKEKDSAREADTKSGT